MREDQVIRLQSLSESLCEVVINEADPQNWPGSEKDPADLTQQERGDRYWSKKNAAASMTLLMKVMNIAGVLNKQKPPDVDADSGLDSELASAERQAQAMIERMQKGGHVH
ncbi:MULTISPECIES: hypothetical protein [Pseudomonas syringae group]|uniref:hypothetical protein n=1 Tax=Pseudomonas syringae group TaxID=136849 RepID=UPI000F4126F1|nr:MULTISPECIES: hypothetical protein [Pseudomonas syringae group]RMV04214.1 hypothetical protein ALP19_01718 [Pseudomonas syringae pv. tomato]